ncbi:hypothetical protein BY996DRAFT_6631328 [Phakopsora pachyrhizi]|nr:hypothetical protein BY996DRAFT_7871558 [Phakopsora pachyrhizi]KAI8462186.1 hypothetical protein BY996DRAFT_6631328 [Phakopsora pachyrhizi]
MARAKALEEALSTAQGNQARSRSGSQSSQNSETSSSAPSTESLSSNQSVATEIGSLNEIGLPSIVPKISYSEWSKFGISLFSPTLTNPNSQLYYQYSRKNNRARSCSTGSPRQATDPNPKYASYCGSYSDRLTAPSLNFEHALPGGPPIRRSTSRV